MCLNTLANYMKMNLGAELKAFTGEILNDAEGNKPLTFKDVAIIALVGTYGDEPNISGREKFERWELASKLYRSSTEEISLTVEEIAKIKELVGKAFNVVVVGAMWSLLEGGSPDGLKQ